MEISKKRMLEVLPKFVIRNKKNVIRWPSEKLNVKEAICILHMEEFYTILEVANFFSFKGYSDGLYIIRAARRSVEHLTENEIDSLIAAYKIKKNPPPAKRGNKEGEEKNDD